MRLTISPLFTTLILVYGLLLIFIMKAWAWTNGRCSTRSRITTDHHLHHHLHADNEDNNNNNSRRNFLLALSIGSSSSSSGSLLFMPGNINPNHVVNAAIPLTEYYSESSLTTRMTTGDNETYKWQPTKLQIVNLPQAVNGLIVMDHSTSQKNKETTTATTRIKNNDNYPLSWPMGKWPDPALRRPAESVSNEWFGTETLHRACQILKDTAIQNHAVGLAAQQCGVNARIVVLQITKTTTMNRLGREFQTMNDRIRNSANRMSRNIQDGKDWLTMVNPRIIERSDEDKMLAWTEECLVLPPWFRANVLRDAWVVVEYQDADMNEQCVRLSGQAARAAQHELDHDRGILIVDHVGLEEMPDSMRNIESVGHDARMRIAYDRWIGDPSINNAV